MSGTSTNISLVLLGGAFSIVVATIGSIISYLAARMKIQEEIRHTYDKSIFDVRLESYAELWRILGPLSSLHLLYETDAAIDNIEKTIPELRNWYDSGGGLLLSKESRKLYFQLRELAEKGIGRLDNPEDDRLIRKLHELWIIKMKLRVSLRSELHLDSESLELHTDRKYQ